MNCRGKLAALMMLLSAGIQAVASQAHAESEKKITGVVYDIDFIQDANWTQIAIRDGFVGIIRDPRLEVPLVLSLSLNEPVTVYYAEDQPNRILKVVFKRSSPPPVPPKDFYSVAEILVDEANGKTQATLIDAMGNKVLVFTRDPRMEVLLAAAMRDGKKIGYLSFESTTREITRAKLNLDEQRPK